MYLARTVYMSQLKWKLGECKALATLPPALAVRTVPAFKITPGGGYDAEEQRVLSTAEHIKLFGRRLAQNWGRRPAFLDAELIDDERSLGMDQHPLTELLERGRLEGALPSPLISLRSSPEYLNATKRFLHHDNAANLCLRIRLDEIERIQSLDALRQFLASVGSAPEKTVLLLDGGALHVGDADRFAHLLAGQVARLAPANSWLRLYWSSTTFPDKPKLRPGDRGVFGRDDWKLYKRIFTNKEEFSTLPMFSDYALEYPGGYKPAQVAPTAHFRYSTEDDYLIFKGTTTRKPHSYKAIFDVADHLTRSADFAGSDFSNGDRYIEALSRYRSKTGNASIWRWASTDHHFQIVHQSLARLLGLPAVEEAAESQAEQLSLV